MWRLPFISREHHEAVLREKDRLVVELRAEIARMDKRAETPVAVSVKLPEDFALLAPAFVGRKRAKEDVKTKISRPEIDESKWAEWDENNLAELAKLAADELGTTRIPPQILAQTVARIKRRIITAKTNRTIRQMEMGTVGTMVPPTVQIDPDKDIPEEIRQRIEMADRGL